MDSIFVLRVTINIFCAFVVLAFLIILRNWQVMIELIAIWYIPS